MPRDGVRVTVWPLAMRAPGGRVGLGDAALVDAVAVDRLGGAHVHAVGLQLVAGVGDLHPDDRGRDVLVLAGRLVPDGPAEDDRRDQADGDQDVAAGQRPEGAVGPGGPGGVLGGQGLGVHDGGAAVGGRGLQDARRVAGRLLDAAVEVAGEAAEDLGDLRQVLVRVVRAARRVVAGGVGDQGVHLRGDAGHDAGRRRHRVVDVLVGDGEGRVALVRQPPGDQLEQHDPGGVDVGADVGVAGQHLLGRQVADRPDDHAGLGHLAGGLGPREAEVGDLDLAVLGDQHVLGLDVAVHETGPVRGAERGQHRLHDLQRGAGAEPPERVEGVAQGAAGDVLHHQEDVLAVGALVVDGDDVGVGQRRGGLGLADEAGDEVLVGGESCVHHLDRDDAVEPEVAREVDRGHAAARDAGLNAVAPVEHTPDEWVCNRRVHRCEFTGESAWIPSVASMSLDEPGG